MKSNNKNAVRQQRLGVRRAEVLRIKLITKFELIGFGWAVVLKIPPIANTRTVVGSAA